MKSKNIVRPAIVALGLLMIPLIAMQFTTEVDWTLSDFVIMGLLIFITGLIFEAVMKLAHTSTQRLVFGAVILVGFLYVWAELAVGIFTNLGS